MYQEELIKAQEEIEQILKRLEADTHCLVVSIVVNGTDIISRKNSQRNEIRIKKSVAIDLQRQPAHCWPTG